jgi:hypothetical protein
MKLWAGFALLLAATSAASGGEVFGKIVAGDASADLGIASYDDPVQVDIALEVKEGRLTARRK